MTTRLAALLSCLLSSAALAQSPILAGEFSTVNDGPGNQTTPHVACNIAPYTSVVGFNSEIRYFNFSTNTDHAIPGSSLSFLSDVSGTRIAFTEVSATLAQGIVVYDTANGTRSPIPGPGPRGSPGIGGNLVAFEDRSFSDDPNESEIVAYDLSSGATVRLTDDALMDQDPSVSPTGNMVVFQKCQTTGFGCDIYASVRSPSGAFTTTALTGLDGEEREPDTNGQIVVYASTRGSETDLYYQAMVGGTETRLAIPGTQRNPSISGTMIAFESEVGGTEYDIFVYDIANSTLYQVTATQVDESLNDVSICGGVGRIVYAAPGNDSDIHAFTFQPPTPPPPACDDQTAAEACANPGNRPLLAELTVSRTCGPPARAHLNFASTTANGLVCVTNNHATSGKVEINDEQVIGSNAFKHKTTLIAVRVDDLRAQNELEAQIAGKPGTSFRVRVYGSSPACDRPCGEYGVRSHDHWDHGSGNASHGQWLMGMANVEELVGRRAVELDRGVMLFGDALNGVYEPLEADAAAGCSAATSGVALSALVVLALWLASRRSPSAARARRF